MEQRLIQSLDTRPDAAVRLFCFPYAGAGASVFRDWPRLLPATIDVLAVQLPGREDRLLEQPIPRLEDALLALARAIGPYLDRPFAFFGHSVGALLCWELAHALHADAVWPDHVFVSSCVPPHVRGDREPHLHSLPDSELIQHLRRLNGTPEEVLANRELMTLLLPAVRADLAIAETHYFRRVEPLWCPATAFRGQDDPDVTVEDLERWRELTTGPLSTRVFPGGHFFLNECRETVLEAVAATLAVM